MKKLLIVSSLILTVLFLLSSCATTVNRIESGTQGDLSGYWNAVDVRIVCDALVRDCLSSALVNQAIEAISGRKPTVIVSKFKNESSEHIDTTIISNIMETVIFNSGKLDFVTGGSTRDAVRAERQEQQSFASEQTAAALGKEIGADFIMTGTVRTIIDRADNKTIRTYFVTAELTNIETNARIWLSTNNDITKVITRPRNRL